MGVDHWSDDSRRLTVVKWLLSASMLVQLAFCPKLWIPDRTFPTIPAFDGLPELPHVASFALLALLVSSTLAVALVPQPRIPCIVLLISGALLVLFDITRLQPWFYQLVLMYVALSIARWDRPDSR